MSRRTHNKYLNREISWLSFNSRVLQEAEDKNVPLIERLRFLGIFSNNRDEFFRVRVATMQRMNMLSQKDKERLSFDPGEILDEIQTAVEKQGERFTKIYREIIKLLEEQQIYFLNEKQLDERQGEFVKNYFINEVRPELVPIMLDKKADFPALKDRAIYLAVKMQELEKSRSIFSLIELPQNGSRFVILPQRENKKYIILLEDVIRYNLKDIYSIFKSDSIEAYTLKITLDAELDLETDFSISWIDKIASSVKNRKKGDPVRFVYDDKIPKDLLKFILKSLHLNEEDNIIPGGRYHNFRDFISFPNIGAKYLRYKKLPPLPHPKLQNSQSILAAIKKEDILLNYPYQSFNYIIDLLREAAIDPYVKSIKINLYRVASKSRIINALINAVKNGKSVTVAVELQARFDEENNINWSNQLKDEGVNVIFGVAGLKVHSKLILIKRVQGKNTEYIAHIGTGNFHEGSAKIYGDASLLTSDARITKEVKKVFDFFKNNFQRGSYRSLSVSPFNTRRKIYSLINNEIKNAKAGKEAFMVIKLNNLVDEAIINKLYEASKAGVKVDLIIRGISRIVPNIKGLSENIRVISIVDRFLEHARIAWFHNGGNDLFFITSADWMERNLDRRVEVTTPIYDESLQRVLKKMLKIQLSDNVKARLLDEKLQNNFVEHSGKKVQSQLELYKYFKDSLTKNELK